MLTVPPKTYFDTQIIIDAERGAIPSGKWECVCGFLRQTTRYCLSPLTIGELLLALAKSNDHHFERDKRRLRLLLSPCSTPEVFDFLPYFAARQLGTNKYRPEHLEDDFVSTIGLILSAPSREWLETGFRHPLDSSQTVRIQLERFLSQIKQLRQSYVDFMERQRNFVQTVKFKQTGSAVIPVNVWAVHVLEYHGLDATEHLVNMATDKFSAMYEHEMASLNLLRNPNFQVDSNASDHVDGQQLGYLSDPETVFITNDSDFRTRIHKSHQARRIKSFSDLLCCAETNRPLLEP